MEGDAMGRFSAAELLFIDHLTRAGPQGDVELDALCAERPDLADELRSIGHAWHLVTRLQGGLSADPSLTTPLGAQIGVDSTDPSSAALMRRLAATGPSATRYVLKGELGRGGMGLVLRAWDGDLRRDLAMKVIRGGENDDSVEGGGTVDPRSLGRFLEEAQVTGQLEHPGIVPVYELGRDVGGRVYFTMRLVRGRNLGEIFRLAAEGREGWSLTRALTVLLKVCEAMAFAHDRGVIHRDLKPANVMVGRFGETYVMDWGLARVLGKEDGKDIRFRLEPDPPSAVHTTRMDDASRNIESPLVTMDGDVVGTPAYMPPEQAAGRIDDIGPPADIYAIGAMLYRLLTGATPYADQDEFASPYAVLKMVLHGPPTPVHELSRSVPPELEAICERAMARPFTERYATMEAMAEDLRAYMEERVVQAHATGPMAELKKWISRNRAVAVTAVASFLVIILLSWWGYVRVQAERNVAVENEQLASARALEAEAERRRVLQVSDVKRLADLLVEIDELWPAHPEAIEAMTGWRQRALALLERRSEHRETLAELTTRLETEPDDTDTMWWHETLTGLITGLDALDAEDGYGRTVRSIEQRLRFAAEIEQRSITDFEAEWTEAIRSIEDREECPAYDGLRITRQLGLVPVGRDPESGLWEFWHVQTGERPARDGGRLSAPTGESGLLFVLIPGGSFRMGSQNKSDQAPNYDADSAANESNEKWLPVRVELDPFLLSKYETTQGQWLRFVGGNPAFYNPSDWEGTATLSNPIENVSWDDCSPILSRLALTLPTEAQWEYACRAGTTSVFHCGDSSGCLKECANVRDRSFFDQMRNADGCEEFDDGFAFPSPVGSLRPNALGLHDMHGNVFEWVRDDYGPYDTKARPGDGFRGQGRPTHPIYRGGSYYNSGALARSAARLRLTADYRGNSIGVRPARPLRP